MTKFGYKRIETILKEPLTRHRRALVEIFQNPNVAFPDKALEAFVKTLPQTPAVKREWENVKHAMEKGVTKFEPNIVLPETQLMWAAFLIYLHKAPGGVYSAGHPQNKWPTDVRDQDLTKTKIWRELTESPQAESELQQHAWHLSNTIRNPDTRIGWNAPGTWFYYSPDENRINLDFLNSLLGGFEHTRSVVFHEIAHSQLTVRFTPRMRKIWNEIKELKDRAAAQKKGYRHNVRGSLNKDDYKRLAMLSAEFKLWMQLFNVTEDNVVNRYSANKSRELSQDYGYSLNHVNTTITRIGRDDETIERETKGEQNVDLNSPEVRFKHLCSAIVTQFFRSNDYFANSAKGWERVRVRPEWIDQIAEEYEADLKAGRRQIDENNKYSGIRPDFKTLRELCSGPNGLENLQPTLRDRLYGKTYFDALVKDYNDRRNEIVELIWDLYAKKYVDQMLKKHEQQLDEQLGNEPEDGQDQDGQDQDGQGQGQGEGQDQDGQDQDGQGQGQGQGQGKPDPNGKPQQGGGGGQGQPQPGDQSQQDPSGGGQGQQDQSGDKGDNQQGGGQGDEQNPWGDPMDDNAAGGAGDENDGKIEVDDVGDMPDYNMPPEAPGMEDPDGQDADGQGQGQDADGDGDDMNGKTIQELLDEMQEQQDADDADGQGQGQDGDQQGPAQKGDQGQGQGQGNSGEGGEQAGEGGEGMDLDKLAQKNWDNYNARVRELAGPIKMVERMMRKIQEQQVQEKIRRSKDLTILPEDGEFDRFNQQSQIDYIKKARTGQKITERDLHRFHKDEVVTEPTQLDVVILIDGSGSMNSPIRGYNQGGAKYVEAALLASAVLYEAAKRVGFNVYVGMWGSSNPMILAKPGDNNADVGRRFAAAQRGLNSGTDLVPAIEKTVDMLIKQRENPVELFGHTHIMVLSDGDINDKEKATKHLTKLLRASPRTTFDAAVMKAQETEMERMANGVEARRPQQKVKVVRDPDPNTIPLSIIKLVMEKMRTSKSFKALPNQVKKRHMRKAANRMGLRNGR